MKNTDKDEKWHCCPHWQRKLTNKLIGREFAIKHGVPVPELYWHGKNVDDIPFEKLPSRYVIKTSFGSSARQVIPIIYDHSIDSDTPIHKQPITSKGGIAIGKEAWLGTGVIVLCGVRIGEGAVIGAGSIDRLCKHDDSEDKWHCCPYWHRRLTNKLSARELAIKYDIPVPELYWYGKMSDDIPFEKLPSRYVIKTSFGSSARQVIPITNGRNMFTDEEVSREEIKQFFNNIMQ